VNAINALQRGELQRALVSVNRDLIARTRAATGADSDAMKAGAKHFKGIWRDALGRRSNRPSAPGQLPAKRSGATQRSIGFAVVEGVMRVGSGLHTARLLETGVNAQPRPRTVTLRGRRHLSSKRLVIAPRPHANVALQRAQPGMVDVTVLQLQRKMSTVVP
jgi:hypothetical protein